MDRERIGRIVRLHLQSQLIILFGNGVYHSYNLLTCFVEKVMNIKLGVNFDFAKQIYCCSVL